MRALESRAAILDAERQILRALCQGVPGGGIKAAAVAMLGSYPFRDSTHQIVFEALREIPNDRPRVLRQQLPARVNNKGFPDLELEIFFQPHGLSASEVLELARALRHAAFPAR